MSLSEPVALRAFSRGERQYEAPTAAAAKSAEREAARFSDPRKEEWQQAAGERSSIRKTITARFTRCGCDPPLL
jgi:hypothetical protein